MATIQLPSLPALPIDPATGDILLIRSAGVDYKVDYDDLVPIRDDTANTFTAANTFNVLTTFVGNIETDQIDSVGGSYVIFGDNLKTNNIDAATGDTVTFDQKISVAGASTFQSDDITINTTGEGAKALVVDDHINTAILNNMSSSLYGVAKSATGDAEIKERTTAEDIVMSLTSLNTVFPTGVTSKALNSAGLISKEYNTSTFVSGTMYYNTIAVGGFLIYFINVKYNTARSSDVLNDIDLSVLGETFGGTINNMFFGASAYSEPSDRAGAFVTVDRNNSNGSRIVLHTSVAQYSAANCFGFSLIVAGIRS